MNKIYGFLLILSVSFISCDKGRRAVWMYYDETKCADKWTYNHVNELLKDNVTSYLKSKKIKIYEMEIFNNTAPEACSACTCKTGRQYKLKVQHSDVKKAKTEGLFEK